MLAQNRSTRGKNKKSKKVGQSKATKSSQGRAQNRWRPLQAWEAGLECQWHGKVAQKRKNLREVKNNNNNTNITKTSWRLKSAWWPMARSVP